MNNNIIKNRNIVITDIKKGDNENDYNNNKPKSKKIKLKEKEKTIEQIKQLYTDIILFLVMFIHVIFCPFTKVEESFNLQAIHDIINIGQINNDSSSSSSYDHLEFPGVIPRTFIGPLIISILSYLPIKTIYSIDSTSKLVQLYFIRLMLGTLSCISLMIFKRSISKKFGFKISIWFILITISQFHLMFYISRPLPNIFALILVLIAFSNWLNDNINWMTGFLTVSIFIFRSEILVLSGPIIVCCFIKNKDKLKFIIDFLLVGFITTFLSIATSVLIDSYFWRRLLYPEYEVFIFNTIENKSSEWGTSPFHWYFSTALPKTMALTIIFFIIGLTVSIKQFIRGDRNNNVLVYLLPIVSFVGLYSILPHKEIRFIFYSIPIINLVSAIGANRVWEYSNNSNTFKRLILSLFTIGILIGNLILSSGFLYVSSLNYPGGHAMISLHNHLNLTDEMGILLTKRNNINNYINHENCKVHIDNLAAISGVSRFSELNQFCTYSKKERDVDFNEYTYLIAPNTSSVELGFKTIDIINSFDRIQLTRYFPFIKIIESPSLYIMEKSII